MQRIVDRLPKSRLLVERRNQRSKHVGNCYRSGNCRGYRTLSVRNANQSSHDGGDSGAGMKAETIVVIGIAGLLAYLLYLFFQQNGGAPGGPGNAGTVLGGAGGASDAGCSAQICAGTPLSL